jgi:3-dehydroquinate synthase
LLSQVDASVGGKTGIDLNNLKNEIGVFSTPKAVFVNSDFISTLERSQQLSGFAEIIKHALISDPDYWQKVKRYNLADHAELKEIISASVTIKNQIVSEDPKEKGLRKILNFGHTIGHALETLSLEKKNKKSLLHGEAIAVGMICEAYISHKVLGLPKKELNEITEFILKTYKHVNPGKTDVKQLMAIMKHDKKNENDQINFSLLSEIGKCEINKTADVAVITEALNFYEQEAKLIL